MQKAVGLVQAARMNKIMAGLATLQVRACVLLLQRRHFKLEGGIAAALWRDLGRAEHGALLACGGAGLIEGSACVGAAAPWPQGAMTVKLNNLAAMEINQVRPFFLGALDMFHKYQRVRQLQLRACAVSALQWRWRGGRTLWAALGGDRRCFCCGPLLLAA